MTLATLDQVPARRRCRYCGYYLSQLQCELIKLSACPRCNRERISAFEPIFDPEPSQDEA